mgnify:FL=1
MMENLPFDLILVAIFGMVVWLISGQGEMWDAIVIMINVLFASLLAMNFWEPVAELMVQYINQDYDPWYGIISLLGSFILILLGLRWVSDRVLSDKKVEFSPKMDSVGKYLFGMMTAWITICFLSASIHTAPLPREFWGFRPESKGFLFFKEFSPDRCWLAFMQSTSEKTFERGNKGLNVFDLWEGGVNNQPPTPHQASRMYIIRNAARRGGASTAVPSTPESGSSQQILF